MEKASPAAGGGAPAATASRAEARTPKPTSARKKSRPARLPDDRSGEIKATPTDGFRPTGRNKIGTLFVLTERRAIE
jgi:hypothetical protein